MRTVPRCERLFFLLPLLAMVILPAGCQNMLGVAGLSGNDIRTYQTMGRAYNRAGGADGAAVASSSAAAAPAAQALPAAGEPNRPATAPPPGAPRQMVYSARFEVATQNVQDSIDRFLAEVQNAGGYLESREDAHVVCRVPAAHFQQVVATMPSLGNILNQTVRNDDVTRKYHDLTLHIEAAEWSRRRVAALLEKAQKIEDVIRLEEELLKLTAAIEEMRGTLQDLSEQVAYSRLEVNFRTKVPDPASPRPDTNSPFAWVNRIGAEQLGDGFGPVDTATASGVSTVAAILPGSVPVGSLEGFLVVKYDRSELKAITADASKLWVREHAVPRHAGLDFWTKAVRADLAEHRGYRFVQESRVRDSQGNEGIEMVYEVLVQGQPHRYMVGIFALDRSLLRSGNTVRTVEFSAPVAAFDKYAAAVRAVYAQTQVQHVATTK